MALPFIFERTDRNARAGEKETAREPLALMIMRAVPPEGVSMN